VNSRTIDKWVIQLRNQVLHSEDKENHATTGPCVLSPEGNGNENIRIKNVHTTHPIATLLETKGSTSGLAIEGISTCAPMNLAVDTVRERKN
jgi:hypothetical protein